MGHRSIVLPARMLWAKGIAEFVSCAIEAKRRGLNARFALVGEPDSHNPQCVPEAQLKTVVGCGNRRVVGATR